MLRHQAVWSSLDILPKPKETALRLQGQWAGDSRFAHNVPAIATSSFVKTPFSFGVMDVLREGVELSTSEAPTHRNTSQGQGQGVSQGVPGDRSEVNGRKMNFSKDVLREGVKVFKSDSLMNQPLDTFNSRAVAGGRRRYRR